MLEHTQHTEEGRPGGGCHLATVSNEARLVAASAWISCPLARSYLAVSVQDLMAADTRSSSPYLSPQGRPLLGVDQPVDHRLGHSGVAEDLAPPPERLVRCDDHGCPAGSVPPTVDVTVQGRAARAAVVHHWTRETCYQGDVGLADEVERLRAENAELTARVSELTAKLEALEVELEKLSRERGRDSSNSGKPPSSDTLAERAKQAEERLSRAERRRQAREKAKKFFTERVRRRPGKQPGAAGAALRQVDRPDRMSSIRPRSAAVAGKALEGAEVTGAEVRQVFDLPAQAPGSDRAPGPVPAL